MAGEEGFTQGKSSGHVLETPLWMSLIRGAQVLIALIVLGLGVAIAKDVYFTQPGLAIAMSFLTWLFVAYIVLTEKVRGLRSAYHLVAVLVLDGLLIIFWLATFADVAATRAEFDNYISVHDCQDTSDGVQCLSKRFVVLFASGLAMMSAIAGLGALLWILFIATFSWEMVMFFRGRKNGGFPMSMNHNHHPESHPMMEPKPQDQQSAYSQPTNTYYDQSQAQGQYPVQSPPAPTSYPQQGPYAGQDQAYYPQHQYHQQPQQAYTGQGYPSPSQHPGYAQGGIEIMDHSKYGPPEHGQPQHGELAADQNRQ